MSIAFCEFQDLAIGNVIAFMQPVAETRRNRLEMLIERFGSAAALNTALGWARTDPKLAQIRNANPRPGRDKPYQMGDAMARQIEATLDLPNGWMDTPPGDEYLPNDERIRRVVKVMEAMPGWQIDQALKIIDTIAEPTHKGNGTEG